MDKETFDKLFAETQLEFQGRFTPESVESRLSKFASKDEPITIDQTVAFLESESIDYTNDVIYSLLSKVLVNQDGY